MSLSDRDPKGLRRTGPLRRTRLRPRSAKAVKRAHGQAAVRRAVFERDGHTCRVAGLIPLVGCAGALHPHHRWLSGQGGPDAVWNEITVCAMHHQWIHANPAESRRLGLYSSDGREPAFRRITEQIEQGERL